jgi:hypothetical protein
MSEEPHELHDDDSTPNGAWATQVTSTEGRAILVAVTRISTAQLEAAFTMGKLMAEVTTIGADVRALKEDAAENRQKLASVPDLDAIEGIAEKTGRHILKDEAARLVTNDKLRILEDREAKARDLLLKVILGVSSAGVGFCLKYLLTLWGH